MAFRILARTLLHLGAELITSDDIALAELIKNSFDAKTPSAEIDVTYTVDHVVHRDLMAKLNAVPIPKKGPASLPSDLKAQVLKSIQTSDQKGREIFNALEKVLELPAFVAAFRQANAIVVRDSGQGMDAATLEEVYLTIGTRSRQQARADATARGRRPTFFGEKGIGRFSVMRLGSGLVVTSSTAGESHWNTLSIDWSLLSHDSDALLEDLRVTPARGERKSDAGTHGTTLTITGLNSSWRADKLEKLADDRFSKLT